MSETVRAWPLLGHLPAFRSNSTSFLQNISRSQGDVAQFRLGSRRAFLFSHPDDIRAILIDHANAFRKGDLMQRARRLLGDGLLTSEGDLHRVQRRRIQPVFSVEQLSAYSPEVPDVALDRASRWRTGMRLRIDVEMEALTMRVVARTLLGAEIENDVPALGAALRQLARWAPLLAAPGGHLLEPDSVTAASPPSRSDRIRGSRYRHADRAGRCQRAPHRGVAETRLQRK